MTQERREEYVKILGKYAEDGKVAIRNVRREAMDKIKADKKASEIS
ncbi:MAG: ribosome recycling factor, partial [Muribaculaceae bacterium]|nr:ribosome recycling factor [Muribaculaceae bacterium]